MCNFNYYEISQLEFYSTDLHEEITIEWFLIKLLSTLWQEGENFSGKKVFGNEEGSRSIGWKRDIDKALIKAGYVYGKLDEHECLVDCDYASSDLIIQEVIGRLGDG
jgi:hypothetical protein